MALLSARNRTVSTRNGNGALRWVVLILVVLALGLVAICAQQLQAQTTERFPMSLVEADGTAFIDALIVATVTGSGTPVDTAKVQGDGNYWFEVSGDSGWTPGYYDIYIDGVLGDSWTNVYIGFGNVPAANSIDSTMVKDGGLCGHDLRLAAVGSKPLADSVSVDTLEVLSEFWSNTNAEFRGPVALGDADADTITMPGTMSTTSSQWGATDDVRWYAWHNNPGVAHLEAFVKAGPLFLCEIDTTGDLAGEYGQFLNCSISSEVLHPSAGAFFVDNRSDSATGGTWWNYGSNSALYTQNFHAQGAGIRAGADIGSAIDVELNEYGGGLTTKVMNNNAWGDAWHVFMDVEDSTSAMWIDMDGASTEGLRIDRNGGGSNCGAALGINNQDGNYRCVDIYNTETAGTVFAIRGEQPMVPYAGAGPNPGDSAIVDIRVGAVLGGASATHSGVRIAGTVSGGRPVMRVLGRTATGNGAVLEVRPAASGGNEILARLKGGISWFSGIYTRSMWYDRTAEDSTQYAGLDTIWDGFATDTLYVGNLAATDIFFAQRQCPTLVYYAPGDIQVFNDSGNARVILIRAETSGNMPYAWLRIREHAGMD